MRKFIIPLLAIWLFPAAGFPQYLSGDTISLKLYSDAVKMGAEIDSNYEYLYDILRVNDNSDTPCKYVFHFRSKIYPIYPNLPYPNPISVSNKQHIQIDTAGTTLLVLSDYNCRIKYILDLGWLEKGSEIWHSPSEVIYRTNSTTLYLVLNKTNYDHEPIFFYNEISEGLEIDWKPDDIYPNCTLVRTMDTTCVNKNNFDFMFEIKDEYPFTVLELLDSNDELIRYFFRMYLDKGIYGVYFSRIDATYKPLEYGDYKLRLTIADSSYICNFKIVE